MPKARKPPKFKPQQLLVEGKEEYVYVAEYPEVGTASQGETLEMAIANLKEATELYLEEFPILNN